ncbi:MAG: acyltransferase [Bacteroidota bacterium]
MKKIEIIDFLKGYSIFTIIIFHYLLEYKFGGSIEKIIYLGGTGVHLFVLISGFGLYYSHLKKPLSFFKFIKKRFSKIYLPYIFIVSLALIISLFLPIYTFSLYTFGGHLFLYKMFDNSIIGSYGYQLWFVSMIFQFYFSFHLLTYLKKILKNDKFFFLITLFISLLWAILLFIFEKGELRTWNSCFLTYLWEFCLGFLIAEYLNSSNFERFNSIIENNKLNISIGITGFIIYGLMAVKGGTMGKLFNDIPALAGYTAIAVFIYSFTKNVLKINFIRKFFIFSGNISYPLYLLHVLILNISLKVFYFLNISFILVISILITFIISFFFQKLINRTLQF